MRLSQLNEAFERLGEEKIFRDIDPNFDINNIEAELDKRRMAFEELVASRKEVDPHYIMRFNSDLSMIRRMLKEDLEELDTEDEEAVMIFFDDLDFRIKHARDYVGLPG